MKTLILVRHAQAVDIWSKTHGQPDHDRPLTPKWIKQSKKLPKLLNKLNIKPQYLVSSTALRCYDTATQISKKFDLTIHTDDSLYFQGIEAYLDIIIDTSDDIESLVLVWHNDDLTDLVSHLLNCNFPYVAKWSTTVIEYDIEIWTDLKKTAGELRYYISY